MLTEARLVETAKVLTEAVHGDFRARGRIKEIVTSGTVLNESISSSDLAHSFAYVSNVELLKQYKGVDFQWKKIAARGVLEDFKPFFKKEFLFEDETILEANGGHATPVGGLPVVPEATEYPQLFKWTQGGKSLSTLKRGARAPFTWEDVINDDWGLIQSLPGQLLNRARVTEEIVALQVLANAAGPNPETFSSANQNAADNKPLNLANLKGAKQAVRNRKVNGNYVQVPKFALVVPTPMRDEAEAILKILSLDIVEGVGTGTEIRTTQSTSNGDVELVVSDYILNVDKSAKAATTWYLVPYAGTDGTRESIVVNFLRRYEEPMLTLKISGQEYISGGAVPAMEGSLRNDTTEYRIRHVVDGGYWYATGMYASTGS